MLSEHDLESAIEALILARKKEANNCDTWKDSGDRGLCHAHKVVPLTKVIEFLQQTLSDLNKDEV